MSGQILEISVYFMLLSYSVCEFVDRCVRVVFVSVFSKSHLVPFVSLERDFPKSCSAMFVVLSTEHSMTSPPKRS